MRSRKLNKVVTIQSLVPAQDSTTGVITDSWTFFAKDYAEIRALTLREFIAAGSDVAELAAVITIRYRAGIKPSMRILHGDRVYQIKGPLEDPKSGREYLVMPAHEIITG